MTDDVNAQCCDGAASRLRLLGGVCRVLSCVAGSALAAPTLLLPPLLGCGLTVGRLLLAQLLLLALGA